ncbi:MAG: CDP-alcohol phosphatidyltransferase [Planctomycetaceae bacterium]|nr:CDP-alcohol phosphatidyltransferase [Planctomycetaceae bacterium]
MPTEPAGRRPLQSRNLKVFKWLASTLAQAGVTPNAISFSSMIFAGLAGAALAGTGYTAGWAAHGCWLLAAVGIQLRLVANLIDGMVAVEGRKGGPTGDLWNEAPDRVSDAAIFIGAGFAADSAPWLGFSAAVMAVFVAYVRALGASVGAGQCFLGPMAKPQRMAMMTGVCVIYALLPRLWLRVSEILPPVFSLADSDQHSIQLIFAGWSVIKLGLVIVILGGAVTAWRRFRWIAAFLKQRAAS